MSRRRCGLLVSGILLGTLQQLSFNLAPVQQSGRLKLRDWEVEVSQGEGGGLGLSEATCRRAALALNATGFVVLRGASIFSDEELAMAQAVAEAELLKVKQATEKVGQTLLERAPWIQGSYSIEKLFEFQEALCYSQGRLDMPKLMDSERLKGSKWCRHTDLHSITKMCFDAQMAQQTVLGALWNFPGSGPPVWHRDGQDELLVAVTAARDYPETVGFIHGQPQTHLGALQGMSPGQRAPDQSLGEIDVPLPLKGGETLLFFYSTKHAATPNLSELERCLIYSVHGPVGVQDEQNHKDFLPSIFNLTAADASELDAFYQRQGYLIGNQRDEVGPSADLAFLVVLGLTVVALTAIALR